MPVFVALIGISLVFYLFCLIALQRDGRGDNPRSIWAHKMGVYSPGSSLGTRVSPAASAGSQPPAPGHVVRINAALSRSNSPTAPNNMTLHQRAASQSADALRRIAGGQR